MLYFLLFNIAPTISSDRGCGDLYTCWRRLVIATGITVVLYICHALDY
jgi:hypothetical protein